MTAVLLLALASVASGPLLNPAGAAAQNTRASSAVARRLLTAQDTDLNNFYYMKPSPDGKRLVYSAIGTAEVSVTM